jgi:pilus assembly protein CpaF
VALPELVRQALRMRPDRIVLGECRGAEVREVLTALNTGHEGGWATVHANTAADVPARLEALAALAGMDRVAVAAQVSSAVDAVVHLRRAGHRRRLAEIGVVQRAPSGDVHVVTAIRIGDGPDSGRSRHATADGAMGQQPDGGDGVVTGAGWPVLERRLLLGGGAR